MFRRFDGLWNTILSLWGFYLLLVVNILSFIYLVTIAISVSSGLSVGSKLFANRFLRSVTAFTIFELRNN
jgi:hypothetical protein